MRGLPGPDAARRARGIRGMLRGTPPEHRLLAAAVVILFGGGPLLPPPPAPAAAGPAPDPAPPRRDFEPFDVRLDTSGLGWERWNGSVGLRVPSAARLTFRFGATSEDACVAVRRALQVVDAEGRRVPGTPLVYLPADSAPGPCAEEAPAPRRRGAPDRLPLSAAEGGAGEPRPSPYFVRPVALVHQPRADAAVVWNTALGDPLCVGSACPPRR